MSTPRKENPYVAGRREWMERYADLTAAVNWWRKVAIVALAVAGIGVIGAVSLARKTKFVPYIVEVGELGRLRNTTFVAPATEISDTVIKATITSWVENTRSVWADGTAMTKAAERSFACINRNDPSFRFVTAFAQENWKRAAREIVSVEPTGAPLPITDRSWQVEWKEVVRNVGGTPLRTESWKGTFEIYTVPSPPEETILDNPLGIYIRNADWTRTATTRHQ